MNTMGTEGLRGRHVLAITLLLTLAAAALRFWRLDESLHVDSLHWFRRSRQFWNALASGDFAGTRLAPHPGVVMMWIAGGVMKLNGSFAEELINPSSLFALKLPGAMLGTLAASLSFPLLLAIWGKGHWRPALLVAGLLATEPALIEQSRMAHLDMAALGFAWLGLLVASLAYERGSARLALGAGALFGAGALTKLSIAPIPAGLMLILMGTTVRARLRDKRGLLVAALATLGAVMVIFALWPALWQEPVATLKYVVTTSERVAEAGHTTVIAGQRTQDPGASFYARYLAQSTPYETGLLSALGLGALWSLRDLRKHYGWLVLAFVPYLIIICLVKKKLTRYVLPGSIVVVLLGSVGLEWLFRRVPARPRLQQLAAAALIVLSATRLGRAARSLPSGYHCSSWPGIECGRPNHRYFLHDLGMAIKQDWQERGRRGTPRVYGGTPKLMSPWQRSKSAKLPHRADYVMLWDTDYADAEGKTLSKKSKQKLRDVKLGKELISLRHQGKFVVRLYATDR